MMSELEASDLLVELGQSLKSRVSEDAKEIGDGLDYCELNFI